MRWDRFTWLARAVIGVVSAVWATSLFLSPRQFDQVHLAFVVYGIAAALPELALVISVAAILSFPTRFYRSLWRNFKAMYRRDSMPRARPLRWGYCILLGLCSIAFLAAAAITVIQLGHALSDRRLFYTHFFHKGFRDQLLTAAQLHELSFDYRTAREEYQRVGDWFSKSFDHHKLGRKLRSLDGILTTIRQLSDRVDLHMSEPARLGDAIRDCVQLALLDPNESRWRDKLKTLLGESAKLEAILMEARKLADANARRDGIRLLSEARSSGLEVLLGDVLPERREERADYLWTALVAQTRRFDIEEHRSRLRKALHVDLAVPLSDSSFERSRSELETMAGSLTLLLNRDQETLARRLAGRDSAALPRDLRIVFVEALIAARRGDTSSTNTLLAKIGRSDLSAPALTQLLLKCPRLDVFGTGEEFVTRTTDSPEKATRLLQDMLQGAFGISFEWDHVDHAATEADDEDSSDGEHEFQSQGGSDGEDTVTGEHSPRAVAAQPEPESSNTPGPENPQQTFVMAPPLDSDSVDATTSEVVEGRTDAEEHLTHAQFVPQIIAAIVTKFGRAPQVLAQIKDHISELCDIAGDGFPWDRLPSTLDPTTRENALMFEEYSLAGDTDARACRHWIESFDINNLSESERKFLLDRALAVLAVVPSDTMAWRLIATLTRGTTWSPQLIDWLRREMSDLIDDEPTDADFQQARMILSAASTEAAELLWSPEIQAPLASWLARLETREANEAEGEKPLKHVKTAAEPITLAGSEVRTNTWIRLGWTAIEEGETAKARDVLKKLDSIGSKGTAPDLFRAHVLSAQGKHVEALNIIRRLSGAGVADKGLLGKIASSLLEAKDVPNASRAYALALRVGRVNKDQIDNLLQKLLTDASTGKSKSNEITHVEEFLTELVTHAPNIADAHARTTLAICDRYSSDNLGCIKAIVFARNDEEKASAQLVTELAPKPGVSPRLLLHALCEIKGVATISSQTRSMIWQRLRSSIQ